MYQDEIQALARTSAIEAAKAGDVAPGGAHDNDAVISIANPPLELRIKLDGLVDAAEESKRIRKELETVESDLAHVRGKLSRESFVAKAPADLVAAERAKEKELDRKRSDLGDSLARLARLGNPGG
jgi:valyl-tRNA synthetase